jgi:hypothetical protein
LLPSVSSASPPVHAAPVWHTYRSPEYGFSIRYPSTFRLYSGHPDYKETTTNAMVPVCEETTVACFEYAVGDNEGTDFQGAGFSVNVLRDRKTEEACYKPEENTDHLKVQVIHGIQFHTGETGVAAAGNSGGGDFYRVFHEGVCFELTNDFSTTSSWIVSDSGPRFKASKGRKISREINAMLQSFTFTGPVKDGPAWDAYFDSCCGVSFEYPRGDTVELTLAYKPQVPSSALESSQHFLHRKREYTVAVKGDIKGPPDLDGWLLSEGYPPLSGAELLKKTEFCKEYHAEPYYYVVCEIYLYILGVSDTSHRAVSPQGDPVFAHLLSTFKVS